MPRTHRHSRASRTIVGLAALLALLQLPVSTTANAESTAAPVSVAPGGLAQADPLTPTAPPPPAAVAAAASAPPLVEEVANSKLDAQLFYELLIGEVELNSGEIGGAYEVLLDAARKSGDESLFKRVTDVALQARAGEQALAAARAWRTALPQSVDAHRYVIQLLVALNRPAETVEPLKSLLALTPVTERPQMITALPLFFGRAGLQANPAARTQTLAALTQVLQPYMDPPGTRAAARTALARGQLLAGDSDKALALAQQAHQADPTSERPVLLALELMSEKADAEAMVTDYLQKAKPGDAKVSNAVRMIYARLLARVQRNADATRQLEAVTRGDPTLASAWLTLGALYIDMRQPADAESALNKFIALTQAEPIDKPSADTAVDSDAGDAQATRDERLTQAYLLQSQAAELRSDLPGAEKWLSKIDSTQRALEVQSRRASLLAHQGKMAEARELIRHSPEKTEDDARAKFLAEAQLLRDAKNWDEAGNVLAAASQRFPQDADLIYEQAMVAEKRNKLDDMERMLRRVMELKPTHQHAYNALGYSLAERNLRLPEARDLIRKALDLVPGEPFITDSLGWVEYRMGNREEALRLLREAYRSRPDTEIGAHLGEVLWVNGQQDEARKVWKEARGRDGANDVLRETLARLRVDL